MGGGVTLSTNYILSADGELYHYGVKGQKWGVRKSSQANKSYKKRDKPKLVSSKYPDDIKKSNRRVAANIVADIIGGTVGGIALRTVVRNTDLVGVPGSEFVAQMLGAHLGSRAVDQLFDDVHWA